MANILLTQKCNQQCPYCFASYTDEKEFMTMDTFDEIIRFLSNSPNEKIGLLGGEPLLHPEFEAICQRLTTDDRIRAVVIYTNGLLLDKYIDILTKKKYALLINCNEYKFYKPEIYKKLENNIRMAVEKISTQNVLLGLNIYKESMDVDLMISLLKELDMHKIRVSLAIPNDDTDTVIRDDLMF